MGEQKERENRPIYCIFAIKMHLYTQKDGRGSGSRGVRYIFISSAYFSYTTFECRKIAIYHYEVAGGSSEISGGSISYSARSK